VFNFGQCNTFGDAGALPSILDSACQAVAGTTFRADNPGTASFTERHFTDQKIIVTPKAFDLQ